MATKCQSQALWMCVSKIDFTEQNRPEIILLVNILLEMPFEVNACFCSEEDDGIMQAIQ